MKPVKNTGCIWENTLHTCSDIIGLHQKELNAPGIQPEERNAILEKAMPWNFKKV